MERCKSCDIRGKTLEVFLRLLRAAAAEAQFPFHWKGWPEARVGTPALAVRPMPVTRNADAHMTTPPFGHPFLKKKGNWASAAAARSSQGNTSNVLTPMSHDLHLSISQSSRKLNNIKYQNSF